MTAPAKGSVVAYVPLSGGFPHDAVITGSRSAWVVDLDVRSPGVAKGLARTRVTWCHDAACRHRGIAKPKQGG